MGILDFLLDGPKKKGEPVTPVPVKTVPSALQSSSGQGSSVLSVLTAPKNDIKLPPATPYIPPTVKSAVKPKIEQVHMEDALDLKGMIPDETLYSGNNEYVKEAAAQRYRQLLHTEYATPQETGLPGWLQTPLQKAQEYTAAGAGYMGDTIQGALGLMGVSKESKLREAVLPEQEMRRIENYLGKYDPEMLTQLTAEKALSAFSPTANAVGQGAAAFSQSYVAAAPIAKALQAVPALNAIRAGSYGAKGIYAMNVLDNAAGAVSAQALHGLTRGDDLKMIARKVAASPSILLPFHNNAMVGVGGIADYFAGKIFLGMNDQQALTHALINLGPNVLRRMNVASQVRSFDENMAQVRSYFDGNLQKQGVPKPLRDEVMDSAQRIYGYRRGNPDDFDGVAKLYDQEGSRLDGIFKEYMKNYGVGENRLIGLKGPTNESGNPLLPGNPNVPQSEGGMVPQENNLPAISQNAMQPVEQAPTAPGGLGTILSSPTPSESSAGPAQPRLPGFGEETAPAPPQPAAKTLQRQLGTAGGGEGGGSSLVDTIKTYPTPVENKVNILDYLSTPENVMKKIGLGPEMDRLRKADEAYRKELPVQIARVSQWVQRTAGKPGASQRIFQWLDGNKTVQLDTNEIGVAKEMKDWYTMWAQRLGIKPEGRITDYVTHIFDRDQQQEFDEDLAKLISDKVPKEVYNPFLQQRKGMPGFKEDAFLAAEVYAKRAARKVNLDPALNAISKSANKLEEKTYQYVKRYVQEVNLRPVETDVLTDNLIKASLQKFGLDPYTFGARPTNVLMKSQRRLIYRGLIGGNIGSAIRNLTQGVNTYAELGEKYTTIGYTNLLKELYAGRASKELADNMVLGMDLGHQDRILSARQKLAQAGDDALFSAFNIAEFINRGSAYYGAKAKFLAEGTKKGMKGDALMEYAIDNAKRIVRKTQFQFGPLDAPLIMRGDLAKSALQLQGFTMKQAEFLANKIFTDKDIAGILRYTAASLAVITAVGKGLGLEGKDFMPGVRFLEDGVGPPMFQLPTAVLAAIFNLPDKYGRQSDEGVLSRIVGSTDVQRGAMMYVPGGAQMQKSTAGIGAFIGGEKRSQSGKSQTFPIEQDIGNFIRAFIYGPYGTREGRDYIEKNLKKPGLLDRVLGGSTGAGSSIVPKSKYSLPSAGGIPKSKFSP